jgi:hypothetical protein
MQPVKITTRETEVEITFDSSEVFCWTVKFHTPQTSSYDPAPRFSSLAAAMAHVADDIVKREF